MAGINTRKYSTNEKTLKIDIGKNNHKENIKNFKIRTDKYKDSRMVVKKRLL
jgi:hypothetical protein